MRPCFLSFVRPYLEYPFWGPASVFIVRPCFLYPLWGPASISSGKPCCCIHCWGPAACSHSSSDALCVHLSCCWCLPASRPARSLARSPARQLSRLLLCTSACSLSSLSSQRFLLTRVDNSGNLTTLVLQRSPSSPALLAALRTASSQPIHPTSRCDGTSLSWSCVGDSQTF